MQETFALKAKRAIKKVAAIGMGVAMLGTTIGGAAAYTLGDYPTPFIKDGQYNSVAYIIGDASTGEDTLALTSVTNKLATLATATSTSTSSTKTGGLVQNVPLGFGIGNTSSAGFEQEVKQSQVSTLRKDTISFQSSTYNAHDELVLGRITPTVTAALPTGQKDYKTDVKLTFDNVNAVKYLYAFDSTINVSKTTSTDPIEIVFLGKNLKITSVPASNSITATVGDEFFMTVGDTVTVLGHTLKLENVGASSCVVSVDGGTAVTITSGTSRTSGLGGLQVKCDSVVSRTALAESAATVIAGEYATKTYVDGDAYVGENKVDPKWIWSLSGLTSNAATTVLTNATGSTPTVASNTPEIAIRSNFVKKSPSDNPIGVGECYDLPNNYLSICMDGLTIESTQYADYTIEYQSSSSVDFSKVGINSISTKQAIHLSGPTEGFTVQVDSLTANASLSGEKKTKEIWLTSLPTNATGNRATGVFYKDTDGYLQYAGNISHTGLATRTEFARINYEDTKSTDIRIFARVVNGSTDDTWLGTVIYVAPSAGVSTSTWPAASWQNDNLTITFNISGQNIGYLGSSLSAYETDEVKWGSTAIGGWDKDARGYYGYILLNPQSNGNSDRVKLQIPREQLLAKVRITGTATTDTGGTGTTAPTAKTASEVTTLSSYNAILVGGPCVNKHVATLRVPTLTYPACGTASGFAPDTAYIELVANGDKNALIVAGWEAADTRRAGVVLANYADTTIKAALAGKSQVTVKGTSLELSGITVA